MGAALPGRADDEHSLAHQPARLALDRERKQERDVADLLFRGHWSKMLREDPRRVDCHRVCEREALLDVVKNGVFYGHAVTETHGKGHEMPCERHDELDVASEVESEGAPYRLDHLIRKFPGFVVDLGRVGGLVQVGSVVSTLRIE